MGIYPCLTYRDIPAAIDWLSNAFGVDGRVLSAGGPGEGVDHAILTFRDAAILVESERPEELHGSHSGQGWVYVTVADADSHYQRARTAGAADLGAPHTFGDGHRGYSTRDLEGNLWTFGTAAP